MIRILYKQHRMLQNCEHQNGLQSTYNALLKNVIMFAPIPLATMLFYFIIFYTKHKTHTSSTSYLQS